MNQAGSKIAFGALLASLIIGGVLLLLTGWWLPEASTSLRLVGFGWVIACITTYFSKKIPVVHMASVWAWLLVSLWDWRSTTEDRSLSWAVYQNIFPLVAVASSLLMLLLRGVNHRVSKATETNAR